MHDRSYRGGCTRTVSFALVLLFPAFAFAAMQDRVNDETVRALRGPLAQQARLRLQRFPIDGVPQTLELERFEVWAPDAKIIAEGNGVRTRLPVPTTRFFRGRIAGQPDSLVFLAVDDGISGFVTADDRRYDVHSRVHRAPGATRWESDTFVEEAAELVDPADHGFTCGTEGREMHRPKSAASFHAAPDAIQNFVPALNGTLSSTGTRTLNLALEADFQLYQNFGSSSAMVTTFLGNLVGASSTIYQRDLRTDLVVVFTRIWTATDTATLYYPTSSADTINALYNLGDLWHNTPPTATPRSAVVRVSGSSFAAGIAWIGAMCKGDVSIAGHWAGAYAYCGGLPANGGSTTVPDPNAVNGVQYELPATNYWSLLEFSHELGHVADGEHTHCVQLSPAQQAAYGVSRAFVDLCYSGETGCYSGTTAVPPEGGTIMSYCHLLGPSNSRYQFGQPTHPSELIINGPEVVSTSTELGMVPFLATVTPDSPAISAPSSVTISVPATASITGPVVGYTYNWSITNGTILTCNGVPCAAGNPGTSITFSGTTDPVTLRVRATINSTGCAASDFKTITVNTACVAPAIAGQPAGTSINQGQSVTLSVTATGTSILYQWYVGSPPTITNPVPGATSSSVTVGPGSTTTYWVQVSNGCGTANSNAATVTVTPTATTAKFYLLPAPCRILDTRGGGAIAANSVRNVVVVGLCSLPSGITAMATNVTVVSPTAEAYATVYPGPVGSARPFASTINYSPGRTLANNANARVAADGSINIFNSGSAPLDLLIDVDGYFK